MRIPASRALVVLGALVSATGDGSVAQTPRTRTTGAAMIAAVLAPTNVAVTGDQQSATITWTAAPSATSYRVLKSTDPASTGQDLTAPIATTSFVDRAIAPGQTVYYTVIAVGSTGMTAAAAPVAFTPPARLTRTAATTFQRVPPPPPPPAASPPVVPSGTGVTPSMSLPGRTVRVSGKGFSALTAVRWGTTDLGWTRLSDTEIDLTLPSAPGEYGKVPVAVSLLHNVPGAAPGTVTPEPLVLMPPLVTSLPLFAECCEAILIVGEGLKATPPSVTIGGVSGTLLAADDRGLLVKLPLAPANDPGGPKTVVVQHAGGSANAPTPLTIVTGPSSITSIAPAVVPGRTVSEVTVYGTNLFRAVGICIPGNSMIMRRAGVPRKGTWPAPGGQPVANDQMTVELDRPVPATGPIALAVPATVPAGRRSYNDMSSAVCQPNPTAVNITVQ